MNTETITIPTQREYATNIHKHKDRLITLFETHDLACLGEKVQESMFDDIKTQVLQQHVFTANNPELKDMMGTRGTPTFGERIKDPRDAYLMSENDHARFYQMCKPLYVQRKLITEDDKYIVNWNEIALKTFNEITDLIINEVLPGEFRGIFNDNRRNITQMRKLHEIIRSAVGVAKPV